MKETPEGLSYGNDNDKYAKADTLEACLEKGKQQTGSMPSAEHEKAETLRMLGEGSHDPYHKNK